MTAQAIDHIRRTAPALRAGQEKFVVRLPDGMRQRLAEVSKANYRSMNSEIIARLERGLSNASEEMDLGSITVTEAQLLAAFRSLKPPMQQALIELFAGTDNKSAFRN